MTSTSFLQESWDLAHPGVYALIGSGAMLGGFTQMTVAVVVMLVEALFYTTILIFKFYYIILCYIILCYIM